MKGKYIVTVKAYDKQYGMVEVRKVFKGDKKIAYEQAMEYAYEKASYYNNKGVSFSATVQGENWQTVSNVNPM